MRWTPSPPHPHATPTTHCRAFVFRRDTKKRRRFEAIVNDVSARLNDHIAEHDFTEDEEDLFLSVVKAWLEEDEEQKQPFYEAVLEWMTRDGPPSMLIRMLSDAVRGLSYVELYTFLSACEGSNSV